MIPRLHKRGKSFKGACGYILHDPGRKTADRVDWTMTQNLGSKTEDAWFEMSETCRDRDKLKAAAGVDARGRKNTNPVLHYTLSWHADDKPTPEHMRKATIDSLKALGLSEHEALIAAHRDKEHMHVHVVVNTVHPVTGKTAPLKFTKDRLRDWALAYEKEHGIRCEERVKNDEKRKQIAKDRSQEGIEILVAASLGQTPRPRAPYAPVKDKSPHRVHWFERKHVVDRMKRMRAEMRLAQKVERGVTWARQQQERKDLDRNTRAAVDNVYAHVKGQFKPRWRELYRSQKSELRFINSRACHLFERAAFVFSNRARLLGGKHLTWRRAVSLIVSGARLNRVLENVHARERRALAREHKTATKQLTDVIERKHRDRFDTLRKRQDADRNVEREEHHAKTGSITLAHAKAELMREHENPSLRRKDPPKPKRLEPEPTQEFNEAARPLTRAEQIERDMKEWRKNNPDRDFEREM